MIAGTKKVRGFSQEKSSGAEIESASHSPKKHIMPVDQLRVAEHEEREVARRGEEKEKARIKVKCFSGVLIRRRRTHQPTGNGSSVRHEDFTHWNHMCIF